MKLKISAIVTFLFHTLVSIAQVPVIQPDLSKSTGIAPAFFGPNAFQVPEMFSGTFSGNFSIELAGDFIVGNLVEGQVDRTTDLAARIRIPLFSPRVNLSLWMPLTEWYTMSPAVMAARRIGEGISPSGHELGPAFISVDMLLMKENPSTAKPEIGLRIALRTASEDKAFASARSYDCPGYFFDACVGKTFGSFHLAVSTGFLCWQTDNGRQNDAVIFGVSGSYTHNYFKFSAQYGGYWGWERHGDFPRTLRARADFGPEKWSFRPMIAWQHGFNDWPFDQYRIGVTYTLIHK